MDAGFAWRSVADGTVAYVDIGVSAGMAMGMIHAEEMGHVVEMRKLPGWQR